MLQTNSQKAIGTDKSARLQRSSFQLTSTGQRAHRRCFGRRDRIDIEKWACVFWKAECIGEAIGCVSDPLKTKRIARLGVRVRAGRDEPQILRLRPLRGLLSE